MSRTTILVLVALGAALAGFAFSPPRTSPGRRGRAPRRASPRARRAPTLGWRETLRTPRRATRVLRRRRSRSCPAVGGLESGLENDTSVSYELGDPRDDPRPILRADALLDGRPDELNERNEDGTLPAVRPADALRARACRAILEPGESWDGTISAPGALVAGSWVRVVFGTLVAVGKPPEELDENVVWITDRALPAARVDRRRVTRTRA